MPPLTRIFNLPATRRSYSSFFSSKPGGGRYFNSAKPKQAAVVAANSKPTATASVTASSDPSPSSDPQVKKEATVNNAATSPIEASSSTPLESLPDSISPFTNLLVAQQHPIVKAKDFKLHQFFSLHRPLLLISNPPSIFHTAPEGAEFFQSAQGASTFSQSNNASTHPQRGASSTPDSGYSPSTESAVDADAEAARQLTRALTMNKAGPTVEWEETLMKLGLDVTQEPDRIALKQQWKREWEDVLMDSTKRKRRKKMKKHKLKKRRRLTRMQRQNTR